MRVFSLRTWARQKWTVGRVRTLFSALGYASVSAGVIGLFVPLWPSTVFFIIALALFAKSNPEAERKLLEHPRIGPVLRDWRLERAISRKSKATAILLIVFTIAISIYSAEATWLRLLLGIIALALVIFLATRREPKAYRADQPEQIV